jgi:hypothetical protein
MRASRCKMARIWTAPSLALATGAAGFGAAEAGAGVVFAADARTYPNADATSAGSSPENKREKKLLKAAEIRLKMVPRWSGESFLYFNL